MTKKDKIKEMISDFHQRGIPELVERRHVWKVPAGKILSIMGVRRSGKTFSFYQIMKEILEKGEDLRDILFVNFEDDRLGPVSKETLTLVVESYYELYPEKKGKNVYLFFDEIQNVEDWERFLRRIVDTEKVKIYVTGSSSKMLSKELATTLRGRTVAYEVFPFSFVEYLKHKNLPLEIVSSGARARVINAFEEYSYAGGFPEIFEVEEPERISILQEYINLIVYKDLIERHNVKNHELVKYLIRYFLGNVSNLFSVNKMYNDLKSQGYKVSKDGIFNYLSYLEEAYCFFSVPVYSDSIRVQQVNPRKIYSIDHGLVTACVWGSKENTGRLLENIIYLQLRRMSPWRGIYYYLTKNGNEVDFVVLDKGKIRHVIQVSETIAEKETMEREVKALEETMTELGVKVGTIITRDEEREINLGKCIVNVVPVWKWLLEQENRI